MHPKAVLLRLWRLDLHPGCLADQSQAIRHTLVPSIFQNFLVHLWLWFRQLLKCLLLLFIEIYLVLEAVLFQFLCLDLFGFLFLLSISWTLLPQADTSDLLYCQPCHAHDAVPILECISLTRLADSLENIC